MEIEKIISMLKVSNRNKVKYRDKYNFIVWGVCLNKEVETDGDQYFIRVDTLDNKINVSKVIEIRAL